MMLKDHYTAFIKPCLVSFRNGTKGGNDYISNFVYLNMDNVNERITFNPGRCGGRPCIRGLRIRVSDILDLLAVGLSHEEILNELPDLDVLDIEATLTFKSTSIY